MENVEYGEILRLVLEQKLHMELITYQSQAKNCDVNYSDNGCFDLIPREAVLYIFQHLDFHRLKSAAFPIGILTVKIHRSYASFGQEILEGF